MGQDDALLAGLLQDSERPADDVFVLRVRRAVAAEETLRAAQRASWRRLLVELIGTAVVLLAFVLLARQAPEAGTGMVAPLGPAAAGLLLIALWLAVSSRGDNAVD